MKTNYLKKPFSTFDEIFKEAKARIIDNNISFKDVSENTGISQELIDVFFDESNNVVSDLSNLIEFTKIRVKHEALLFRPFIFTDEKEYIKITKTVRPRCSVYFSKITKEFYRFYTPHQKNLSETDKQIILNELHGKVMEYIEKNNTLNEGNK